MRAFHIVGYATSPYEISYYVFVVGLIVLLMMVFQVVAIRDIIPPPLRETFNDVYIAYELMDTDLHQIIRSNQALSEEHCQVTFCTCAC